jgi:hypothetical protein
MKLIVVSPGTFIVYLFLSLTKCLFAKNISELHRSDEIYKKIFQKSGLKIVKEATQHGMPKELFEVKM